MAAGGQEREWNGILYLVRGVKGNPSKWLEWMLVHV